MNDNEVHKTALKDEQKVLKSILDTCLKGSERAKPALELVGADVLDRKKSDADVIAALNGDKQSEYTRMAQLSAYFGVHQESQRVRRDAKIMQQTHKRLMFGCLQTLYARYKNLDILI